MAKKFLVKNIGNLPDAPGVYFFLGKGGEVLYIGKATSLRDRVKSYFKKDVVESRGPLIITLMERAKSVRVEETDSVLEALILEARMIKKHQPPHNTREKSDKSFNYVIITKEDFPRVLLMRERELLMEKIAPKEIKYRFGPFPNGTTLREALRILRKIFPFRDKCLPAVKAGIPASGEGNKSGKPCFHAQIGLCPGVCAGWMGKHEYKQTIQHIRLFFEGKKKALIGSLEREMKKAVKEEAFERAGEIKKQIFAVTHIRDVSLIKREPDLVGELSFRIESYDVAHISGKYAVGVMTVLENGEVKKSDYRKFKIKSFTGADDTRALKEVLERRLGHLEWPLPGFFVIDGGRAQYNTTVKILREHSIIIPVVSVVKDEHHRPKDILGDPRIRRTYHDQILLANSEAHRFAIKYHRELRDKMKT